MTVGIIFIIILSCYLAGILGYDMATSENDLKKVLKVLGIIVLFILMAFAIRGISLG